MANRIPTVVVQTKNGPVEVNACDAHLWKEAPAKKKAPAKKAAAKKAK